MRLKFKESTFIRSIGRDPNRDAYAYAFMDGILKMSLDTLTSSVLGR
ncbi:MAG: hypothetical protein ACO3SY_08485 [Flavobacteriaceae bacterium]